jgi:sigma-B regulation protein RsbU (phosphoserine phosphatase)
MSPAAASRILLCAADPASAGELRGLLTTGGHAVDCHSLKTSSHETAPGYDLIIIESGQPAGDALALCRKLRLGLTEAIVPILLVLDDSSPSGRLACLEAGADTYLLRPFTPGELLAQVQAFLRLKRLHDRATEKTSEFHRVNKQLRQNYQQLDHELELARRIQHGLLPQSFPELPPVRFAVHYRPYNRVGGDFYDVFRLDENHVGFYVADVMGHGIPASLLTIFLKKAVRTKEISGRQYRLLPPDEVLQHVNRELIDHALAETPFITMAYGVYNRRDGMFSFARAGHPYPLYVPHVGEPRLWQVHGTLLGVFETEFSVQSHRLRPGDKVLFCTDGLDVTGDDSKQAWHERLLTCAGQQGSQAIDVFVENLARSLLADVGPSDDCTLLGMEVTHSRAEYS